MFIQIEETPNPATLKFLPGRILMEEGTAYFANLAEAERSPLATRLFGVQGVAEVFFGSDFITIAKTEEREWYLLKPALLGVIMEHLVAGRPILLQQAAELESAQTQSDDDTVVAQIKDLLDTRVRPAVARDGGDIVFRGFDEGIVYLHMQGACAGCPSASATLKIGIENMLRHYIPEVAEVRAVL